jgi:hypothetical protein
MRNPGFLVLRERYFSLIHSIQSGSGAKTSPYQIDTEGCFLRG